MNTLYARLKEIAISNGLPGRSADIRAVTGLSRGRVSQIKADTSAASVSAATIRKLADQGYSPAWILEGKGPMRLAPVKHQEQQDAGNLQDKLNALRAFAPLLADEIELEAIRRLEEGLKAAKLMARDIDRFTASDLDHRPFKKSA